jgi:hypothetical protein
MPFIEPTCDNPDELLAWPPANGPIDHIQIESSATGGGAGYSNIGSVVLQSLVHVYSFYDSNGSATTWYRWYFSNSANTYPSSGNRQYSPEVQAGLLDAYTTTQAFRTFIRNGAKTDALDPDLLIERIALEAAARAIDSYCGRVFRASLTAASPRIFTARDSSVTTGWYGQSNLSSGWYGPSAMSSGWYSQYSVDTDDVFDTTGATVAFDATGNGAYTQAVTGFRWMPSLAPSRFEPYNGLLFDIGIIPPLWQGGIQVTSKWGWTKTPAAVQEANLIQAARWMKRRDAPFGIAGSPEFGNELRLLPKLDPDLQVLLRHYRLNWGVY